MDKADEIILFFSKKIRDCTKCPIREECNNCDKEFSCDEMADYVLERLDYGQN